MIAICPRFPYSHSHVLGISCRYSFSGGQTLYKYSTDVYSEKWLGAFKRDGVGGFRLPRLGFWTCDFLRRHFSLTVSSPPRCLGQRVATTEIHTRCWEKPNTK